MRVRVRGWGRGGGVVVGYTYMYTGHSWITIARGPRGATWSQPGAQEGIFLRGVVLNATF